MNNFDAKRILSTEFFDGELETTAGENFYLPRNESDEAILQNFAPAVDEGMDTGEKKIRQLTAIKMRVAAFTKIYQDKGWDLQNEFTKRAGALVFEPTRAVADNPELKELYTDWQDALDKSAAAGKLQSTIGKLIRDVEGTLRKSFRREFADRLKQARQRAGLTQIELALRSGISQGVYTNLETAKAEPSLYTLRKFSQILNVNPNWLLYC